jgi:hypothetical protein
VVSKIGDLKLHEDNDVGDEDAEGGEEAAVGQGEGGVEADGRGVGQFRRLRGVDSMNRFWPQFTDNINFKILEFIHFNILKIQKKIVRECQMN